MLHTLHVDLSNDTPSSLSYEVSGQEHLSIECDDSGVRVFANRKACVVLAQIFGKLALGSYEPGFHIHLRTNFDDDAANSDAMTVIFSKG